MPKACTHSPCGVWNGAFLFTFIKQAHAPSNYRINFFEMAARESGSSVRTQTCFRFSLSPRRHCFFLHFPPNVRSTFVLFLSFFNCLDVFSDIYDRFCFQMELTLCGNVAEKWDIKCKQHLVTSIVFVNLPVHTMFPHCFNKLFLYITQLVASPNQENG